MVRVKLLVRIIPEDVYLKDAESPAPSSPANFSVTKEKRLLEVVRDPESVSIGILANRIRETFQRINHESVVASQSLFVSLIF